MKVSITQIKQQTGVGAARFESCAVFPLPSDSVAERTARKRYDRERAMAARIESVAPGSALADVMLVASAE